MTSLSDKAAGSPDVRLIRDAQHSAYRLKSTELVDGNDITPEGEFPQYGEFLETVIQVDGEPLYVECPQDLAASLVELEIAVEDWFRIGAVRKVDGEWQVDVTAGQDPQGDGESS